MPDPAPDTASAASTSTDLVLIERDRDRQIAVVTLNRPDKLNAFSIALRAAVVSAFRTLSGELEEVGCIVLTGAGRGFSAGVDLKELGGESGSDRGEATRRLAADDLDMVGAIRACPQPVIAAVNGVAITGGFEVVLACDIVIASTAARFADTHARVGILPTWGMTQRLPRLIGVARAKELSFSGRFLDAASAERWGLVNHVVEPGDLMATATALAADIAGADRSALAGMKRCYDEGLDLPFAEGLRREIALSSAHMRSVSPEAIAARRAAVQERGRANQ